MNTKYTWSVRLTPEQVAKIRETWNEVMGQPAPLGSGLFGTISFATGRLRLMALAKEETEVLRRCCNQIALQTKLDDLDKRAESNK
ncbi:MAG TPA: hypothetical protein PLG22_07210 [Kiritimatiellia bacterium]|nr:hypothetical protein [Kiritimatiellia bacterium]